MNSLINSNFKKYKKKYERDGFVLLKNYVKKQECKEALEWLKKKIKTS